MHPAAKARQAAGGAWKALGVLGLMLLAEPAGAWYKHVASPRYHTVGRASGLLMGIRRSPYLWRRDSADPPSPPDGRAPRGPQRRRQEARADGREPPALTRPAPQDSASRWTVPLPRLPVERWASLDPHPAHPRAAREEGTRARERRSPALSERAMRRQRRRRRRPGTEEGIREFSLSESEI